jgi:hypothetical protein
MIECLDSSCCHLFLSTRGFLDALKCLGKTRTALAFSFLLQQRNLELKKKVKILTTKTENCTAG